MHQRDTGQYVVTATTTDEQKAKQVEEWIDSHFNGNDSVAVWYAVNSQMQRDIIEESNNE